MQVYPGMYPREPQRYECHASDNVAVMQAGKGKLYLLYLEFGLVGASSLLNLPIYHMLEQVETPDSETLRKSLSSITT